MCEKEIKCERKRETDIGCRERDRKRQTDTLFLNKTKPEINILELIAELCEVRDYDVIPDGLADQHQVSIHQPNMCVLRLKGQTDEKISFDG